MKIAVLNIYNGVVERGAEIFVHELANRLVENHTVTVFQTGKKKQEDRYTVHQVSGVPSFPHQGGSKNSYIIKFIRSVLYNLAVIIFTVKTLPVIMKQKYDWLLPINGRFQTVLCRVVRFVQKNKVLISGHAGIGFEDKFNILLGQPNVFVALTPTAYTWAKQIKLHRKIAYIPNGIDTQTFRPDIKPITLDLPHPRILCVGALLPYKRVQLVIHAVKQLNNASLLVIGDGPLRGEIQKMGKDLLGDRFLSISSVPHWQIAHYYTTADVFTLPSESNEAFGLVYLEALACNLPVVAPDDPARRELISGAGYFCNPQDSKEYARKLQLAIETDFGNKPRLQAEKFSWATIAKQYEKLFAAD